MNRGKTNQTQALEWWNSLSSARKTQLVDTNPEIVRGVRKHETLTDLEIKHIWVNVPNVYKPTPVCEYCGALKLNPLGLCGTCTRFPS